MVKVYIVVDWENSDILAVYRSKIKAYKDYKVLIKFVGGPESNRWPTTMAVRDKNDDIMNDIWDRIHAVFSLPVDIYSTNEPRCR